MGSTTSRTATFVLASIPGQPFPAPSVNTTLTSSTQIAVNFRNLNTETGGSPITKIELEMDDGNSGPFTSILLTSSRSSFIVTSGIQVGLQYRFRYHVSNVNGWSDYSDISYIFAFAPPDAPPAPTFISGTDTSVTLNFYPSRNDRGIRVANYELYIDQGNNLTSEFRLVPSYSAFV